MVYKSRLKWYGCKSYRRRRNMSLGKDIRTREQASGSRAYLETRLSCLGTGFPLPEDFSERVREGIIFNLSDTSQRFEEKHLEPSFEVANSAIFSTSAVNSSKPDPCRQDQPGSTVGNSILLRVFAKKLCNFLFWELVDDKRLKFLILLSPGPIA